MKANYEAGLIDLDGMMGKMRAISLATGKAKFATADSESEGIETRRGKKNAANRACWSDSEHGHVEAPLCMPSQGSDMFAGLSFLSNAFL